MALLGQNIDLAIEHLDKNELVAIPTETVYGLAGNAFSEDAVLKIFEVKNRPSFDPLIVHVCSWRMLVKISQGIPKKALELADAFWPGPLTLLVKKRHLIPDIVTSGLETVAVRIPDHPLTLSLLKSINYPLAAPSANPFGYISPTTASHVNDQLGNKIPYILDGGPCTIGIESTIIGFDHEQVIVHRLGGKSIEDIQAVVGKVVIHTESDQPAAPGMLLSHYAPAKKVIIGDPISLDDDQDPSKIALLRFQHRLPNSNINHQYVLSESGDLREAAKNLFSYMREMDKLDITTIYAEKVPETGIGLAINDRLLRASN